MSSAENITLAIIVGVSIISSFAIKECGKAHIENIQVQLTREREHLPPPCEDGPQVKVLGSYDFKFGNCSKGQMEKTIINGSDIIVECSCPVAKEEVK